MEIYLNVRLQFREENYVEIRSWKYIQNMIANFIE